MGWDTDAPAHVQGPLAERGFPCTLCIASLEYSLTNSQKQKLSKMHGYSLLIAARFCGAVFQLRERLGKLLS